MTCSPLVLARKRALFETLALTGAVGPSCKGATGNAVEVLRKRNGCLVVRWNPSLELGV